MFGCRVCPRDVTELTRPEGHRHCDGGAGISHTVAPRCSSTVDWMVLMSL